MHAERLPSFFHGAWVWLDRRTWETVYLRYEQYLASVIKGHLAAGDVFYDVGAHWGFWSLYAAHIVGRNGKVFSFEPSDAFSVLTTNTENVREITRFNVAVGNEERETKFYGQGIASSGSLLKSITELSRHWMPETPIEPRTVKVRTLDSILEETQRAPALMKIDVEGYEWNVLDGARELIAQASPTIVMEVHPGQLHMCGKSEEAVFELLADFGYAVETLNRNPNTIYTILAKARRSASCRG
jgi:FkbM family methyltransferase